MTFTWHINIYIDKVLFDDYLGYLINLMKQSNIGKFGDFGGRACT